jgi:preprotein translocase subunit Sec61beta
MSNKDRVSMPASTAGLTRYFEDYRSKIEIKPAYVIVLAVFVMLVVILLNAYGSAMLG